ncbi:MAG: DUF2950 family protein [Acetobacteraceae bacterium]|nr:DUF2950 family protein [Acetobacteraceae bacterium]
MAEQRTSGGDKERPMRTTRLAAFTAGLALGTFPFGVSLAAAQTENTEASSASTGPASFESPQAAVAALKAALAQSNPDGLIGLFGSDAQDLFTSPDQATARTEQQHAAKAIAEQLSLVTDAKGGVWLLLGHKQWPFPFELTQADGKWSFGVADGRARIVARRIGTDELTAIDTLHALVAAQRVYATRFKSPSNAPLYARYIESTPGSTDGLWWDRDTAAKAGKSPLALPKGSSPRSAFGSLQSEPFHGYYFRVLTAQGSSAPGGAKSYIPDDDQMTDGFAIIAWAADYGATGVMTFLVGPDGRVLQRDLGQTTDKAVRSILAYDPTSDWSPAQ